MANPEHLAILKQGVEAWNKWRKEHPDTVPDLSRAELQGLDLSKTNLGRAYLRGAKLDNTILRSAILWKADLAQAHLHDTDLREANLRKANLFEAELIRAKLQRANLTGTLLVDTKLQQADLTGCFVYGCSVWNVELEGAAQLDLVLLDAHSSSNEWNPDLVNQSAITVDHLEVAQFIYLLLNNEKIRNVIDTIGKKGVLILGRFTEERKAILHAIRDELRDRYNLLPIMFEFDPLSSQPTIKTLSTLAHLSRFVIADLTDAKSVLQELTTILKDLPTLPVKPIIHESDSLPPMGDSFLIMQSMLRPYVYTTREKLLSDLQNEVIEPAEERVKKFEARLAEIRQEWFPWQRK